MNELRADELIQAVVDIGTRLESYTEDDEDGPGVRVTVVDALLEIASAVRYLANVVERGPMKGGE